MTDNPFFTKNLDAVDPLIADALQGGDKPAA